MELVLNVKLDIKEQFVQRVFFFSFLFGKKYIGTFINVLTDFLAAAKETAVLF